MKKSLRLVGTSLFLLALVGAASAKTLIYPIEGIDDLWKLNADEYHQKYGGINITGLGVGDEGWYVRYRHENLTYFFGPLVDREAAQKKMWELETVRDAAIRNQPKLVSSQVDFVHFNYSGIYGKGGGNTPFTGKGDEKSPDGKSGPGGDIDGDGIANKDDPDMDGDGIANAQDGDVDGDGIPNGQDKYPFGSPDGVGDGSGGKDGSGNGGDSADGSGAGGKDGKGGQGKNGQLAGGADGAGGDGASGTGKSGSGQKGSGQKGGKSGKSGSGGSSGQGGDGSQDSNGPIGAGQGGMQQVASVGGGGQSGGGSQGGGQSGSQSGGQQGQSGQGTGQSGQQGGQTGQQGSQSGGQSGQSGGQSGGMPSSGGQGGGGSPIDLVVGLFRKILGL